MMPRNHDPINLRNPMTYFYYIPDDFWRLKHRKTRKNGDALRAEPTNKASAEPSDGAARAEPNSLELCRVATEFEELKLV